MDSVEIFNRAVSIVGYCIFDSNYKKALPLTLDSLNLICPHLVGKGMFAMFESVFFSVRYINNTGKINITDQWITDLYEEIKVEKE